MSDIKERQSSDSDQGGEGTVSLHNKGWEAMTKDIGSVANTVAPEPADDTGTK